MVIGIGLN